MKIPQRYLVNFLLAKANDDIKVIEEAGTKPGIIEVAWLRGTQSLLTVLVGLNQADQDSYFYVILGYKPKDHDIKPGLYVDNKRSRWSWILIPDEGGSFDYNLVTSVWNKQNVAMFGDVQGKGKLSLPIDAVIGVSPQYAQDLSMIFSSTIRTMPGISRHDTGVVEEWGRAGKSLIKTESIVAVNLGTWHVFLSNGQMKDYVTTLVRPFLSPATYRKWIERCYVRQNGLSISDIDSIVGPLSTDRGRSVGHFYRIGELKKSAPVFELYEKLYMLRKVNKIIVTTQSEYEVKDVFPSGVPHILDFTAECRRDVYLKKMSQTAVAIFNSRVESAPTAPIEAAAVGCIPLLANCTWVNDTFGAHGWKFIYNSMDEAAKMIEDIFQHYEEYAKYAREFVIQYYNANVKGAEFMSLIRGISEGENTILRMSDDQFEHFCDESKLVDSLKFVEGHEGVSWDEVNTKLYMPRNRLGKPVVLTKYDVPAILIRKFNLWDDLKSPYPFYESWSEA